MALRIGPPMAGGMMPQINAASPGYAGPAVLPEEALPLEEPVVDDVPVDEPMGMESGSVVEWIQEAIDLCKQTPHSDELAYALEQALILLIGPSAVGATEPMEPSAIESGMPEEEPLTEEEVI